ncbi:MAG: succinate dehydrogenase cytochrome b subunit [bacterium]|nr:succinate dehydrogenase cytochrome b subunit [bacterium]
MPGLLTLHRTTIGKKVIMAVTGLIWIGFLVMHMYGNLKIFNGAEYFNQYAEGLRTIGAPIFGYSHLLWIARIGLLAAFVLHVWAAIQLTRLNKVRSRPVAYRQHRKLTATHAQLSMVYGGIAILIYVIYHLLHLTFGVAVHPDFIPHDAYHNVLTGLSGFPAIIYLVALVALGLHLFHGTWSLFQTLGLNSKKSTPMLKAVSAIVSLIVCLGFAAVPIAVLTGYIRL